MSNDVLQCEEINTLYDFYGCLLTDKQQDIITLYYQEDLSLSEIAEENNISRAAVQKTVKNVLEKLNYYEWAKYLEKINDDSVMDHLLTKIDKSSERENLSVYRKILFEEFENERCFYCGKKLSNDGQKVHVDHFVPRAFIKDDKMWNLVLACPTCNLQKNDKLAAGIYMEKLLERNKKIILVNSNAKDMRNYSEHNLRAVYYWAKINGYDNIWQPKKMYEV